MTAIPTDPPAGPTHAGPGPTSPLMEFILGILAPLLIAGGITDIDLARTAAAEAIAVYKVGNQPDLMTIGQIIAFAVTALDNLPLSMTSDLSLSMKLKLRGSANALNRSARTTGLRLEPARHNIETGIPDTGAYGVEPAVAAGWLTTGPLPEIAEQPPETPLTETPQSAAPESTAPQPAVPQPGAIAPRPPATAEHRNRLQWADAMMAEAARLRACPTSATAEQQRVKQLWQEVLTNVAADLTKGNYPALTPGMTKAELLRSTLMSGDASFPAHLITRKRRK